MVSLHKVLGVVALAAVCWASAAQVSHAAAPPRKLVGVLTSNPKPQGQVTVAPTSNSNKSTTTGRTTTTTTTTSTTTNTTATNTSPTFLAPAASPFGPSLPFGVNPPASIIIP